MGKQVPSLHHWLQETPVRTLRLKMGEALSKHWAIIISHLPAPQLGLHPPRADKLPYLQITPK